MLISGRQIKSVDAEKIVETEDKKFVSQAEKDLWNRKATINDSSTNTTDSWSSSKVKQELDKKVNLSNNYSLEYDQEEEAIRIIFK